MRSQLLALGVACLLLPSCTKAGLQAEGDDVAYVDDKLAVQGEFCVSDPDEVSFPVKVLIVMDQSASLQCTDPHNVRLSAMSQVGAALDPLPNVEFGVIGFASWSRITDFTTDWGTASDALAPDQSGGGPATDYQGSLATALTVLEQDMIESGPAEVARSKYVVLFISDGNPEPQCTAGCDDGDKTPDSLYGVCNYDPTKIPDDVYVDYTGKCPDYNQQEQIISKVQDIVGLSEYYGAGSLTFNTILLWADEDVVAARCGGDPKQFGYVREEAEPLLQSMADEGGGTYRDLNLTGEIDFLNYDYESLQATFEMGEFFAYNTTTIPTETGPKADSDGDGLSDEDEFAAGLDRLNPDSDGDGFSDFFEVLYEGSGFDALDGEAPAAGCSDTLDRDNDGLKECEEDFIGTDKNLVDTDGDRIPDGIELRFGMDPTEHDTQVDHDFDGRLSGDELRSGTHPALFDDEEALLNQVLYSIQVRDPDLSAVTDKGDTGGTDTGDLTVQTTRCYDFDIQGITLVPTLSNEGANGKNRILVYAEEEPAGLAGSRGTFHVGCMEPHYLGETYKDPPSGIIDEVDNTWFVESEVFDGDNCFDPTLQVEDTGLKKP